MTDTVASTTTSPPAADAIDAIAGIAPGSPAAAVRAERPEITRYAQSSYLALLEPAEPGGLSRRERELVALRVAVLTPDPALAAWHRERLAGLGVEAAAIEAAERYPEGAPTSVREAALLRHTDLVTRAANTATAADIAALKAGGLGPAEIVSFAQLVGFLSYQVRALAVLRSLAEGA